MKVIELTQGKVALVDDEDYELVSQHTWCAECTNGYWYATTNGTVGTIPKTKMHRLIMQPGDLHVDHINGNGLDNQRSNLRVATRSQNAMNQRPQDSMHGRSSKYKGVVLRSDSNKWRARIKINQKEIALGSFDNEEDAARAYDAAAIEYFGEFAHLNFGWPV